MMKWLFLASGLILVVAGFVILPRTLLNVSGNSRNPAKENVPVGALRRAATAFVGASGGPATPSTRRFVPFASVASEAGFTPLTPAALPAGYAPWEQYVRQKNPAEVVITFAKGDGLFVLVDERVRDPNARPFLPPIGGGRQSTPASGRGGGPQQAIVVVNGASGLYVVGPTGIGARQLADANLAAIQRNSQPHRILFVHNDLEIIVEADQTDVTEEQLVRIAEGLR
jgi:hypothetical protein